MPRVIRIINRFNLGGPTWNAALLSKYLPPEYETLLIGGQKEDSEESSEFILQDLGVKYAVIPEMKRTVNPLKDADAFRKIKKIILNFKPDIVHTHAAKAGALGRRAAFACRVPVTVHTFHGHVFHSYFGKIKTSFFKSIEKKLARKTSAIIALSERQKEELANVHQITSPEKIHVIPLGLDLRKFREHREEKRMAFRKQYALHENELAIGIVGRLVPVKNHSLFLKAVKFVSEKSTMKIKAFVIGNGEERKKLDNLARKYSISEKVIFTSWVKDIENVYPGLDIICLTSLNEGTPVSLIEALASGKPVVCTSAGGTEDVVENGKTGLLSLPGDEMAFCSNLLNMAENRQQREVMSQNGWEAVKNKFSYSALVQNTSALYEKMLQHAAS